MRPGRLPEAADRFGTPAYVYNADAVRARLGVLRDLFGSRLGISYAIKANPNRALLGAILPLVSTADASSWSEVARALALACEPGRVTFSGPARCPGEIARAVAAEVGELVVEIRACDAGFNAHLAACGLMGGVIRRDWVFANLSNPDGPPGRVLLTGPLCTSIDRLASDLELPEVRPGDVLAIAASGAYGLTASPTRFISHPELLEILDEGGALRDVSESRLNREDAA